MVRRKPFVPSLPSSRLAQRRTVLPPLLEHAHPPPAQTLLIDPANFRVLTELLNKECKGRGRIETIAFAATATSGH